MTDLPRGPEATNDDADSTIGGAGESGDVEEVRPVDPRVSEHDPTGTDLAARVARAARGGVPRSRTQKAKPIVPTLSGAGADPRDPKPAESVFDRFLAERGWQLEVSVHSVMGRWPQIVGPELAEHSAPEAFDSGVLVVRTSSTAWATQLRALAPLLVAKLNEIVGDGAVARVDVRGPDAPKRRGRLRVKGEGPGDTWG